MRATHHFLHQKVIISHAWFTNSMLTLTKQISMWMTFLLKETSRKGSKRNCDFNNKHRRTKFLNVSPRRYLLRPSSSVLCFPNFSRLCTLHSYHLVVFFYFPNFPHLSKLNLQPLVVPLLIFPNVSCFSELNGLFLQPFTVFFVYVMSF